MGESGELSALFWRIRSGSSLGCVAILKHVEEIWKRMYVL